MFKLLFLVFLLVPVVEIYFLIQVGSVVGALSTVVLVVATALIGAFFVRQQGLSALFRYQDGLRNYRDEILLEGTLIIEGFVILVAGILLLIPGFVTDAIGFTFLVGPLRRWFISRIVILPEGQDMQTTRHDSDGFIEGHFRRDD